MFVRNLAAVVRHPMESETRLVLHSARKRCCGCAVMRSVGQFEPSKSDYCLICTRRGISCPKSTVRRPL